MGAHLSLLLLLLLLSLSLATTNSLEEGTPNQEECTYAVWVKTGTYADAGTSSVISLILASEPDGENKVEIDDLISWSEFKVPSPYSYFQKDSLDVFRGTAPCLPEPPCWMVLSSSGTGGAPNWYVQSVEVTIVRSYMDTCNFQRFAVNTWLGPKFPLSLFAVVDKCSRLVAVDGSQSI